MLPIAHSSQRFHTIDQAVNQLPQAVTRIISEYDCTNEEYRKMVKTMTIENLGAHERTSRSNPCPLFANAAARVDAECPTADIIIELIDKVENCGLFMQRPLNKKIVFTTESEGQPNTPSYMPERRYCYMLNRDPFPFHPYTQAPEQVLLGIIDDFGEHLFLKNGDMSHRRYSKFRNIFKSATFINIDFSGTTFENQDFNCASFIDCDLTDVMFDWCRLDGAKFSRSILKNTIFKDFTSLSYAIFKHVIFEHTQFISTRPANNHRVHSCHKVVATDRLFLAKIRMHCSWDHDQSTCIPTRTDLYFDNGTSFQYTSPSKPFQKWISSCPIL